MFSRACRRCRSVLLALVCANSALFAQVQPKVETDLELPLAAEQTAEAIGLKPLYDRLRALYAHPDTADRWELLYLQQQAMLRITTASLQVDASAEQVDSEIAEIKELENYLTTRRDSRVLKANLTALLIGGVAGTASSALGFTAHDNAAAALGIVGGAGTTLFSLAAIRLSQGESRELMAQSNMLSKVFAHPSDANNVYPPVVVSFMDAVAPNDEDGLSRQDRLIHNWVTLGRIPDPKLPEGKERVNHVASLPGQHVIQSISDLEDRQAMLYDLRVRLNYIKLDLAILLNSLPTVQLSPVEDALLSPSHKTDGR
jgi:hypothetical protein